MLSRHGRGSARPETPREPSQVDPQPAPATATAKPPEGKQQPPPPPTAFPYRVCRDLALTEPPLTGPDVQAVQHALQVRGFYQGPIGGIYDASTARAVARLQSLTGAIPDGRVTREIYQALVVACILRMEGAPDEESDPLGPSPSGQLLPPVVYSRGPLVCRLGPLYRAGSGETLFSIADRFGYLPQQVVAVNPHIPNPDRIPEGETVALPFPSERRR